MTASPLKRLLDVGQSAWLDFIDRELVSGGELGRMIDDWGVRGMTSNPTIFEQAIARTKQYDADIARLAAQDLSAEAIYETLAIADVRAAADAFAGMYASSGGEDGYVSLEVSPHLARAAAGTIAAARRLWAALDRPNAMIKVPGTDQGLAALRTLIGEGINVNVTLLFSVPRYREVAAAYAAGLEDALAQGRELSSIASVASFFLSRIDTAVDRALEGRNAPDLAGEAAIASARLAYAALEESLAAERWRALAARGARVQRLLWASTGTKNPAYGDVKYVEPLIGAHTVNTMPLDTLRAYHDHGEPAARIAGRRADGAAVMRRLADLSIDIESVAGELLEQGIDKFVQPYDALLAAVERARARHA